MIMRMKKPIYLILSCMGAAAGVYLKVMLMPVFVLVGAMAADYISGTIAAWISGTLNSKTGKRGAVKKVCYMFLVVLAGIMDWVIGYGLGQIGISFEVKYYFGLLVTIWLILNECLSIIENCTIIGIPVPKFIKPIADRLKLLVEEKEETEIEEK